MASITITSVDNVTGEIIERQYDNRRAKFFQDGKELTVPRDTWMQRQQNQNRGMNGMNMGMCMQPQMQQQQGKRKYMNKLMWEGKNSDIKVLKIQLGLGCNYSCTYCKQAIHVNQSEVTKMEDVDHFIENFDTWCTAPKEDPIRIELWGGEPMIYIGKMRKLVEFFKKRFDQSTMSIVTNGSLITVEKAKWLIENDIRVTVSHDGKNTTVYRLEDPLAEGSASLEGLRYYAEHSKTGLGFNSVMTKVNSDPLATEKYLKSLFNLNCKINLNFEGIVMVEDIDQFTPDQQWSEEEFVQLRDHLKKQMVSGAIGHMEPFRSKLRQMMLDWSNPFFEVKNQEMSKCGMDDGHTIATTLKGTALVCHGSSHELGSIYDLENVKMENGGVTHWAKRPECGTCPVLNSCRGSCMDIEGDSAEWYWTCTNQLHFHLAIFEAAFELIFNETVLTVTGDFIRPKLPQKKKAFPIPVVAAQ